jgi:hypothetical protein
LTAAFSWLPAENFGTVARRELAEPRERDRVTPLQRVGDGVENRLDRSACIAAG